MSNLSVFDFEGYEVRLAGTADKPEWVASDVCTVLGISKYRDAISRLEEYQRGSVVVDTLGGKQRVATVTESGLYALIFTSRKEEAKRFQRWVFEEVLPQIRKTGGYGKAREGFEWFERVKLYRRHTKIPTGWFSIFEEMCSHLMADFEDAGYSLPMGSVPDISVGKHFCQHLRDQGYDTADQVWVRKYQHRYPDGRIVDANIYCIELLAMYRIWFEQTYTQIHLIKYLKSKDRLALPSLCKMLGLPEGTE